MVDKLKKAAWFKGRKGPVVLVIMDGVGFGKYADGDAVATAYGVRVQGADEIALTKMDVLSYMKEIPVVTAYEIDGRVTEEFPTTPLLKRAKPVWTVLPGWKCDITGIRRYEELPENCRRYIEFIEEKIGFPVTMVSNGPSRDDIIYR